ncbi:MAG: HIT family protein [Rhodospirillaceae bacterium]|jgi:diadenosine tetraphosphate (Ap4A) HIT family hydrolase|nr:HIT family protein [Rhodospirillaceae bacterium]MBT5244546.1 HIT family protein [Rhodospirillaceae bacterium]MBT5562858.1 HIT family protein [Rhodospirillaceae bacterium]MBT6242502.1 HIT family protein [Rhodospirillaceae bacterium]MBT7137956.1 HIT family protein [Rhodospirillaceae bacterium]
MFQLHPTLATDTIEITRWKVSRVQLMKDANYPWLILVPARQGLSALHELEQPDLPVMMGEIVRASEALKKLYNPTRVNVAALGNMVEQLHVHVIARFEDDVAWPKPVWGVQAPKPYTPQGLEDTANRLRKEMGA